MVTINKDTAYYLAKLCALKIDENEADRYSKQLNDIIEYAQKLNELDTDNIDPSFHATNVETLMREDQPAESAARENILNNAPDKEGSSFAVPRILE